MLVNIDDVNPIGDSQISISSDDQKVLIIVVRSLVSKVMATRDDCTVVFIQWVDDNDFVVNDCMARAQEFGMQITDWRADRGRPYHRDTAILTFRPPD